MRGRWHWWQIGAVVLLLMVAAGFTGVETNFLGAADRLDRLMARVGAIIHPAPRRSTLPTVVYTPYPSSSALAVATPRALDRRVGTADRLANAGAPPRAG